MQAPNLQNNFANVRILLQHFRSKSCIKIVQNRCVRARKMQNFALFAARFSRDDHKRLTRSTRISTRSTRQKFCIWPKMPMSEFSDVKIILTLHFARCKIFCMIFENYANNFDICKIILQKSLARTRYYYFTSLSCLFVSRELHSSKLSL